MISGCHHLETPPCQRSPTIDPLADRRQAAPPNRLLGVAAIGFATAFNIPYPLLAATFEYPAVLRLTAAEVLARFTAGGPRLTRRNLLRA